MAAIQLDPPRSLAPVIISDKKSLMTEDWLLWFYQVYAMLVAGTQTIGTPLNLTSQAGAIAFTTLPLPALQNGRYRVSWFIQITQADSVSSSVQLTIGFTHLAQALTKAFPAVTGNALVTFDQGSMYIVIDQNTPITYQTAYTSATPGQMRYFLSIIVEAV